MTAPPGASGLLLHLREHRGVGDRLLHHELLGDLWPGRVGSDVDHAKDDRTS